MLGVECSVCAPGLWRDGVVAVSEAGGLGVIRAAAPSRQRLLSGGINISPAVPELVSEFTGAVRRFDGLVVR